MGRFTAATLGALLLGSAAADRREDVALDLKTKTSPGPGASVVGGADAPPERYPYATPLIASGQLCGGALIHPRAILTAAHCLPPTAGNETIVPGSVAVGRWDLATAGGDVVAVAAYAVHPEWNPEYPDGPFDPALPYAPDDPDFGLLLLETPSAMTPARLGRVEDDPPLGTGTTAMGWGWITPAGPISLVLKEAQMAVDVDCGIDPVNVTVDGEVVTTYPAPPHVLCASPVDGHSCAGDSGGPLVVRDAGGDPAGDVVVGVVSYGPGNCAEWGGLGAYARVAYGRAWIEETLAGWELALPTDGPTGAPTAGKSGKAQKSGKESGKASKSTGAPTPSSADTGAPTPSSADTGAPTPSSTKAKKATKSTKATKTKTTKSRRQ